MTAVKELGTLTAADLMTCDVITLRPDATLHEAVEVFMDHRITGAPVVDDEGAVQGVVSLTDVVRHFQETDPAEVGMDFYQVPLPDGFRDNLPWARGFRLVDGRQDTVRSVMTRRVIAVDRDAPLAEVAREMWIRAVHRLLVVGKNGQLAGIISSLDLAHLLARNLGNYPS